MELFAEAADVAIQKNLLAYHTMMKAGALNERAKELQAYITGDPYYMEAGETPGKAKNFLVRAWEALIRFLKMIKEKLFRRKVKVEPGDKVVVSKPFAVALRKLKGAWASVKGFLKAGKGKLAENPKWKILMGIMAALTVAGGVFFVIRKKKKKNAATPRTEQPTTNTMSTQTASEPIEPEVPKGAVELPAEELKEAEKIAEDMTDTIKDVAEEKKSTSIDSSFTDGALVPDIATYKVDKNFLSEYKRSYNYYANKDIQDDEWISELNNFSQMISIFENTVQKAYYSTGSSLATSGFATDSRWKDSLKQMRSEIIHADADLYGRMHMIQSGAYKKS